MKNHSNPNPNLLSIIHHLGLKHTNDLHEQTSGHARQRSAHRQPTKIGVNQLLDNAVNVLADPALRTFLASVIKEPEVRKILIQPVLRKGVQHGIRVESLQTVALGVQYWCSFGDDQREVLYLATVLHGIQHSLAPCIQGGSDYADFMFTLARSALHTLDDAHPSHAGLLRLCMGWANADEESDFALALRERMQRAVETLDLLRF
jgi:hypothetical protein